MNVVIKVFAFCCCSLYLLGTLLAIRLRVFVAIRSECLFSLTVSLAACCMSIQIVAGIIKTAYTYIHK